MIYVLSNHRIDTLRWARSQGISNQKIRHVQNARSLPGVLNPKKTRIVKLPSYAKRFDKFAIQARLKLITRRAKIEIEEWYIDPEGNYGRVSPEPVDPASIDEVQEAVGDAIVTAEGVGEMAAEALDAGGTLPSGPTEIANDTGKIEAVLTNEEFLEKVGKAKATLEEAGYVAIDRHSDADSGNEVTTPASYAEGEGAASVSKTTLPVEPAEKATEPVDFLKKAEIEAVEEHSALAHELDQPINADKPQDVIDREADPEVDPEPAPAEFVEPEKPKRTRRTKVQMAYDEALVAWESNGGSVEAVQEARKALKEGDPRLDEDPTQPDDLIDDDDDLDF